MSTVVTGSPIGNASSPPADPGCPLPPQTWRIFLIEDSGLELAFEADNARSLINWAREWLRDPIDLAIALFPPGVSAAGKAVQV